MTKARRKYPIRISLMTEKGCEMVITIDRGKDTPEDHAFVKKLQHDAVTWLNGHTAEAAT